MEKKPKVRVFTKKKRGTRKFIAENHNLIRNESQQAGLLEYDHNRMGYVMPKVVSPEMIEVAKAAQQRAKKKHHTPAPTHNILKGQFKPAKKGSDWCMFWGALELYDRTHKSTVTAAMKVWLERSPEVRKLKNKPRIEALKVAASNMIAHLDKKSGRDSSAKLVESMKTDRTISALVPVYEKPESWLALLNQKPVVESVTKKLSSYSVVYQRKQVPSLPPSVS